MMADAFIPLFESGMITNKNKNFLKDRAVSTFCMGSRTTYDYIDNNPSFYFGTADFVNNPLTIGRARSAGCIRMANWDASRIPELVRPGAVVVIK